MTDTTNDNAAVIAPPPFIYLGFVIAALVLHNIYPLGLLVSYVARGLGAALVVGAITILFASFHAFRRAETNVMPTRPTTKIISTGVFSWTRNPIYLAFTLAYIGIGLYINTVWAFALLPLLLFIIQRGVIEREERYLEKKFGAEYTDYKTRVRRWL